LENLHRPRGERLSFGQWVNEQLERHINPAVVDACYTHHREGDTEQFTAKTLERLHAAVRNEFLKVCHHFAKDVFAGCEYSTSDLWNDEFDLRSRNQGVFGYDASYDIVIAGQVVGLAAYGVKQGSCYLSFTGRGCALLDMSKLQRYMRKLPLVKITRVDIAFDDFEGVTGFEHAKEAFMSDRFVTAGRPPKCGVIQSDGEIIDGQIVYMGGSTFYVGRRQSGKMYRGYEKGRQKGDPTSPWFRHEVEIRAADREIPLHVLTDPDTYFAGAYPYCADVLDICAVSAVPTRIATLKREAKTVYDRAVLVARRNVGALINTMRHARGLSDSEIVEQLIRDAVPARITRCVPPGFIPQTERGAENACNQN
jgi:phage replication initiation protein